MIMFFENKIKNKGYWSGWRLIFQLLPNVQLFVLIYIFAMAITAADRIQNLGYILFFVIFTAYKEFY
jgi:hypothetical protein